MVSENKMDSITIVALIAHHTPNLTSFNSTLWNFLQTVTCCSEEMKQSFVAKMTECGVCFTVVPCMMVPVHKIILDLRYSLVASVIHGCLTRA
jgi:hypothetical protein